MLRRIFTAGTRLPVRLVVCTGEAAQGGRSAAGGQRWGPLQRNVRISVVAGALLFPASRGPSFVARLSVHDDNGALKHGSHAEVGYFSLHVGYPHKTSLILVFFLWIIAG